jgi:hypothetical protein
LKNLQPDKSPFQKKLQDFWELSLKVWDLQYCSYDDCKNRKYWMDRRTEKKLALQLKGVLKIQERPSGI